MQISNKITSIFLLLSLSLSANAFSKKPDQHEAIQTSHNWTGYYFGEASNKTKIWLELNEFDGELFYEIISNPAEKNKKATTKKGKKQINNHKKLTIQIDNKKLLLDNGVIEIINLNNKKFKKLKLKKITAFSGNGIQLLIHSNDIKFSEKNNLAKFKGLINFEHIDQGGHQSLMADFVIDCKRQQYNLDSVNYYAFKFGTGNILESAENNDNWLTFSDNDDVIKQASEIACP